MQQVWDNWRKFLIKGYYQLKLLKLIERLKLFNIYIMEMNVYTKNIVCMACKHLHVKVINIQRFI